MTSHEELKNNIIDDCILKFIGKLYNNDSISRSVVQVIIDDLSTYTKNIFSLIQNKLKTFIPEQFHSVIDSCVDIPIFEDLSTEYKRIKYLQKNKYYVAPFLLLLEKSVMIKMRMVIQY